MKEIQESSVFAYLWSSTISLSISEICFSDWCHSPCGISMGGESHQRGAGEKSNLLGINCSGDQKGPVQGKGLVFLLHGIHTTTLKLIPARIHLSGLGIKTCQCYTELNFKGSLIQVHETAQAVHCRIQEGYVEDAQPFFFLLTYPLIYH